jgi:hypothetical protein
MKIRLERDGSSVEVETEKNSVLDVHAESLFRAMMETFAEPTKTESIEMEKTTNTMAGQ